MIIEISVAVIALILIALVAFLIPLIIEIKRTVKKVGALTHEVQKDVKHVSDISQSLLGNALHLTQDIQSKSKDLDVLFRPLHHLRNHGLKDTLIQLAVDVVPLIIKLKEGTKSNGTPKKTKKRKK